MLAVKGKLFSFLSVSPVAQEPALSRFFEYPVRKIVAEPEGGINSEGIGCVFLPSQDRHFHFADHGMADLVHNDKKHIAEYELDQCLPVF